MKFAPIKKRVRSAMRSIFAPIPSGTIEGWASGKETPDGRANVYLTEKESGDFAGPYDPTLNPLPTILFHVFRSGLYNTAVFLKSSQSGVTLACLVLIMWFVCFIRRNFLYVLDSLPEMERLSKERMIPMLLRCRAAEQVMAEVGELKTLTLALKHCVGYLTGAQSVGALSNKSVGLAIIDEVDAHPDSPEKESARALAAERGKKQSTFFQVLLSKPIFWHGPITQEYLTGTRHHPFYPCPHCGTFQEVVFEQLRADHCRLEDGTWDYDLMMRDTWYECINKECAVRRIEDKHKPWMLERRDWRQTNLGQDIYKPVPRKFSCKIDDLMSTFPTATWGHIMIEWAKSENDRVARRTFEAGRLARGEKREQVKVAADDIQRMRGTYQRGECPVMPDLVVMFVDVQKILLKWVKCGFTLDDTCYVIDYGETLTLADAYREADVKVKVLGVPEDQWPVTYKGWIDEGHDQKVVRDFITSEMNRGPSRPTKFGMIPNYRFYSSWGQGQIHARQLKDLVTPRPDEKPNVTHNGFPLYAYRFSDDHFKDELYNLRIGGFSQYEKSIEDPENFSAPEFFRRTWFPENICDKFRSELTQEEWGWLEKEKKFGWKEPRNPNDFGDGVKGCLAEWYIAKPFVEIRINRERAQAAAKAREAAAKAGDAAALTSKGSP